MASTSYSCRLERTTDLLKKCGSPSGTPRVSQNCVLVGKSRFWGKSHSGGSAYGPDLPLEASRDSRLFILPRVTFTPLRNYPSTCCQSNDSWHSNPPANRPHQPGANNRANRSVSSRSNADVFSPKGSEFHGRNVSPPGGSPPLKRRKAPRSAVLAPERSVTFQIPPPPLTHRERSLIVEATGDPEIYLALYNRLVKLKRYPSSPSGQSSPPAPSPPFLPASTRLLLLDLHGNWKRQVAGVRRCGTA